MFDIGFQEMLLIMVLALLVFGPSKLPELGKMIGRAMREFRRASDEFRSTVETNLKLNEIDETPPPPVYPEPTLVADPVATPASPVDQDGAVTDTPLATVVDEGEPYYARRGSALFHSRQCAWATRIEEADRVYFKKVAEARDQGFRPCPVCEPWEPA